MDTTVSCWKARSGLSEAPVDRLCSAGAEVDHPRSRPWGHKLFQRIEEAKKGERWERGIFFREHQASLFPLEYKRQENQLGLIFFREHQSWMLSGGRISRVSSMRDWISAMKALQAARAVGPLG